jgi:hypothetical protein
MVHPHPGPTSTNSSSSLLAFFNLLTCTEPSNQLRRGQEICTLFARSSFPKLGYSTKPTYSPYIHLHSALKTYRKPLQLLLTLSTTYNCLVIRTLPFILFTSPSIYLYITKSGLHMGKHMGQHLHTRYIIPNPKKGAEISRSPLHLALRLRQPVEVPKIGQT